MKETDRSVPIQHQRMYPDYKFQPMKKEEKEKLREQKIKDKVNSKASAGERTE